MGLSASLLKCLGAICILTGSGGLGYGEVRGAQNCLEILEQIGSFLQAVEHQILYGKSTLAELMSRFGEENRGALSGVCRKMHRNLQVNRGISSKENWKQAVEEEDFLKKLEKADGEHLENLMDCLCTDDPTQACKLIQKERDYFEERIKQQKEKAGEKRKMMLKISIVSGLFVCLVLW